MSTTVYSIFPAIGIARVGNAPDEFYIGPESACGLPILPDGRPFNPAHFRDQAGRLLRQAARFRVYRQTDHGPAEEVTLNSSNVVSIRWRVHVANKSRVGTNSKPARGRKAMPRTIRCAMRR